MQDAAVLVRGAAARPRSWIHADDRHAAEVAALLDRAGVDHASSLWFQLLELATGEACDWSERAASLVAPLAPTVAALLGLRSVAADLLVSGPDESETVWAAAEACLAACAEAWNELCAGRTPERPRRWGEGAVAPLSPRPRRLQGSAGCC